MTNPQTLPYASPSPLATLGHVLRDGDKLVVKDRSLADERCILCGETGVGPSIRLPFTWDPSFKVTQEATLQLRQKAEVEVRLCRQHRTRYVRNRRWGIAGLSISAAGMLACIITAIVSESSDVPRLVPWALGSLFLCLIFFVAFGFVLTLGTQTVSCSKIEGGYVWIEGCSPQLLAHLPTVPAPASQ